MTFSLMFHHFHSDDEKPAQGSITADQFNHMLVWLKQRYIILDSSEYKTKYLNRTIRDNEICISFDDALKSQIDIALPVLENHNIKAYFFIYSSIFTKDPDPMEIYRYFRSNYFINANDFYQSFFEIINNNNSINLEKLFLEFQKLDYLSGRPYYSEQDKWFRYLRDCCLGDQYHIIMKSLMRAKNFNPNLILSELWMSKNDLINLNAKSHTIGLHTHNHPTKVSSLSKMQQFKEYRLNLDTLTDILRIKLTTMSHPCGDYNKDTLNILESLGIEIGFKANLETCIFNSKFGIPRENHVNILKMMQS